MTVSKHQCPECGRPFTCTPAQDQPFETACLADDCITYDPDRDLDVKMGFKEPPRTDH